MTVRLRLRREAEADVIDALSWYRERGLELGEAFLRSFDTCLTITVLACFHAKRNPTTWKERAKG
jgi:hypothetical protein